MDFIVPAMGSHGGSTAEGQRQILAEYGITQETMGVPVCSSMEVEQYGALEDGTPLYCDKNAWEADGVILFNKVQVPHYNYVGDSILGYKAHMGAGSITSNMKSDKTNVRVVCGTDGYETGLRKFGAALGDFVEVGCNSVLNPGTVVGKNSVIYPLSMVRGAVPAGSMYKKQGEIVDRR